MLERAVYLEELKELLPVAKARKSVLTAISVAVGHQIERHVFVCDALIVVTCDALMQSSHSVSGSTYQ
jgi:hypothetical protein